MEKIFIINSGGTFNKLYNPTQGTLDVDTNSQALKEITTKWKVTFDFVDIINKDSLDFTDEDRELIAKTINQCDAKKVMVVHGTDTMDITAKFLSIKCQEKVIVLTGAMMPFSIDSLEATANFAMSYGFLQNCEVSGVYICMNGVVGDYTKVKKDKIQGYFVNQTT